MERIFWMLCLFLTGLVKTQAQVAESAQLALNIEKLAQFKQILSDMKKGYQVLSGGYNTIKGISQGNFNIHKVFLDGLMQVSPTVRNYRKVGDIVNFQIMLVQEYNRAYNRFRADGNFTVREIGYLGKVYDNLFKESLRNLDELTTIITAGNLRMSDDERLKGIDAIFSDMEGKLNFLRQFNQNTSVLSLQRAKERKDAESIKKVYGLNN
ncbi:TerB family tellurite resistance protein [Flavobacterium cerinum]|uniref:TerB family tellurite resistance protein n=1 Tax=Flavobacterium cerinum TaxID=2502784 RepID=A0ABY5IMZ4_9FLAO|nr:TerB family tellurite resistance protein [Flavobacterium cerinum]UUC44202.1 TerB family tellurite resistance protein [Flavobacterium cerinum]